MIGDNWTLLIFLNIVTWTTTHFDCIQHGR